MSASSEETAKLLALIRSDYSKHQLQEKDVLKNPVDQFLKWMKETIEAQLAEPNAMTLSTVDDKGKPASRIVLLRGVENGNFVFFTNYESNKGKQLLSHPDAALNFFWYGLERQVNIKGKVKKVDEKFSDEYFATRPRESQLGAWASPQGEVIESREMLVRNFEKYAKQYENTDVPRPPHWGGFILVPDQIEFWQGRTGRLHDRILYSLQADNTWNIQRLAP